MSGIAAPAEAGFQRTKINMSLFRASRGRSRGPGRFCVESGLTLQRIRHYSLRDAGMEVNWRGRKTGACARATASG